MTGLRVEPGIAHPHRGEIARYLLSRGLDPETGEAVAEEVIVDPGAYPQIGRGAFSTFETPETSNKVWTHPRVAQSL